MFFGNKKNENVPIPEGTGSNSEKLLPEVQPGAAGVEEMPTTETNADAAAGAEDMPTAETNADAAAVQTFMLQALTYLMDKTDELTERFDERIARSENEGKIFESLNSELQKYRSDMYSNLLRPVLLDIVQVRDSIIRMSEEFAVKPEGERDIPHQSFAYYAYDLQDILEKNGVEMYRSNPGDRFVPVDQRPLKKVLTDRKDMHGLVAESLSFGYRFCGRVISPEKITVYVYQGPADAAENKQGKEDDANG